jgi:hypothetical protein
MSHLPGKGLGNAYKGVNTKFEAELILQKELASDLKKNKSAHNVPLFKR